MVIPPASADTDDRNTSSRLPIATLIDDGTTHRLAVERCVIEAFDLVLRRWPDPPGLRAFTEVLLDGFRDEAWLIRELYNSLEAKAQPTVLADRGDKHYRMVALSGLFDAAREGRLEVGFADATGKLSAGRMIEQILATVIDDAILDYVDMLSANDPRKYDPDAPR